MTYSVLKLIEILGDAFPLLLSTTLNRIPILIAGEDVELVDDVTGSIARLTPHRHNLVFSRDISSETEVLAIWDEERHDYEIARTSICCFSSASKSALEHVLCFDGWLISVPLVSSDRNGPTTLNHVIARIMSTSSNCGVLRIHSPSEMRFNLVRPNTQSLTVEKSIVHKIVTRRQQSLERIRRLLSKSLRDANTPRNIVELVLNLEDESEKLTSDMFEEEVNSYIHAARRAVTILSRIRLARELGAPIMLTERSLFEAIGWESGDLNDLIQFIHAEWHENFMDCVKNGALLGVGAWVDSMWGS